MKEIDYTRTFCLTGDIDEKNTNEFLTKIINAYTQNKEEQITLQICSFGGSVAFGFHIYDTLMSLYKPRLQTIVSGTAASIALIIFLTGEHRVFCPSASILIHKVTRRYKEPVSLTDISLRSLLGDTENDESIIARIIEQRTCGKITSNMVLSMMEKDTYIYAPDVLRLGLAHEVLT